MILATRVQAHPSRAHEHEQLLARLEGLDPQIVLDPGGKRTSSWRTHRLCLEALPADATHLLVLQDDAWPCNGFAAAARAAIQERPETVLCLFSPGFGYITRPMQQARKAGERWMPWRVRAFIPLVAIVYPAAYPTEIIAFSEARKMHMGRADDAIVATWARAYKRQVWATVPCLVQHRDELASVMKMVNGKGAPHRLAAYYAEDGGKWVPSSSPVV